MLRKGVTNYITIHLEAFAVDDGGTGLVIFLLADSHLLEGGQPGQNEAADPHRTLALRGRNDFDHHSGTQDNDRLHPVDDAWEDGGPTRQHCVGAEVLADVDIILRDEVEGGLVDSTGFHNQEGRLEEHLRAVEPLIADSDDLSS